MSATTTRSAVWTRLMAAFMAVAFVFGKPLDWLIKAHSKISAYGGVKSALKRHLATASIDRDASMRTQLGQAGDLIGVTVAIITVGVIVFVGISIMSSTRSQTNVTDGDPFYQSMTNFTDTMGNMFGYIGLAMLAAMASVIIGYLVAFRGSAR